MAEVNERSGKERSKEYYDKASKKEELEVGEWWCSHTQYLWKTGQCVRRTYSHGCRLQLANNHPTIRVHRELTTAAILNLYI